jgi:AraC-like DNA-binding protein
LYSCVGEQKRGEEPFVPEHVLGLIIQGSIDVFTENGVENLAKGTLSLVRKNQLIKAVKKPDAEKPFMGIYIFLDTTLLKNYSMEHNIQGNGIYAGEPNVMLQFDPFMKGYFDSLMPYFDQPEQLTAALAKVKTIEAIELLLRNPTLKNFLFDFSEPHKIDLEAFMNRYFSYNVPITQFAKLTGRSISSFKRDFTKVFNTTPEKWLQNRRLEMAFFLISQRKKRPSEVYLEVGFENLSHFSTAFKNKFGVVASGV